MTAELTIEDNCLFFFFAMCNALKTDSPTDKYIRVLALIMAFMMIVNLPFRQKIVLILVRRYG